MTTKAQALYDFRYNKVKLASKSKVKTAYGPPMCPESWDSRHIGCLSLKGFKHRATIDFEPLLVSPPGLFSGFGNRRPSWK